MALVETPKQEGVGSKQNLVNSDGTRSQLQWKTECPLGAVSLLKLFHTTQTGGWQAQQQVVAALGHSHPVCLYSEYSVPTTSLSAAAVTPLERQLRTACLHCFLSSTIKADLPSLLRLSHPCRTAAGKAFWITVGPAALST